MWCLAPNPGADGDGKPEPDGLENPKGTLMPGKPAKLVEVVKISFRYIFSGSADLSPSLKAGEVVTGLNSASQFLKTSRY